MLLSFYDSKLLRMCPYFIPLGLVYCATSLDDSGIDVKGYLLDYPNYYANLENEVNKILNQLSTENISIICISAMSVDYAKIRKITRMLKQIRSDLTIILGGGCMSADPLFVFENTDIDYGLVNEGDFSLPLLVKSLISKVSVSSIQGLVYQDPEVIINENYDIKHLDSISFPNYDLFPEFSDVIMSSGIYPILLSRSCPFRCTFCFHTCGNTYRVRSSINIFDEIEAAQKKYNINHLFVIDELFGADMKQLKNFTKGMKQLANITYNAQTRADFLDEEKLIMLKDSGCKNISIGIESINQTILDSMNKSLNKQNIEDTLEKILSVGLTTNGNIILGDKNETYDTAMESIEWFEKNYEKYNLNINHIQIYPGTELFEHAINNKEIDKKQFLFNAETEKDFVINISSMSEEEYKAIYKRVNGNRFLTEREKDYFF